MATPKFNRKQAEHIRATYQPRGVRNIAWLARKYLVSEGTIVAVLKRRGSYHG